MTDEKVTLYELTGPTFPTDWVSDKDRDNYIKEAMSHGTAMCQWTTEGKIRHVPRSEWSVFED